MDLKNWKTSAPGVASAVITLATIISNWANDKPLDVTPDKIAIIIIGIGMWFAKDKNVTGGTVSNGQTPPPLQEAAAQAKVEIDALAEKKNGA